MWRNILVIIHSPVAILHKEKWIWYLYITWLLKIKEITRECRSWRFVGLFFLKHCYYQQNAHCCIWNPPSFFKNTHLKWMTKQHSCVSRSTFIILHSQTKTSNSWIMKKNIFIGSRPRSRDREVIIFENYSCSSLFLATWGSTIKSQGHCWPKRQFFKSHAHHTLTVRSYPKLKHKRFSTRFM